MCLMNKIFSITTPLSTYLQFPSNDYIEALAMVDVVECNLSKLRTQESFEYLLKEAEDFSIKYELDESELYSIRQKKRKLMSG